MCFAHDSRPPAPPNDLLGAPIAGGAGAELLELRSADGTSFSAAFAESANPRCPAIVLLPDLRGLFPFYVELAERFAQAGHHAIAIDYYGRTAGLAPRSEEFEYRRHFERMRIAEIQADVLVAIAALRGRTGDRPVAAVGFCLGAIHSFLAATSHDHSLDRVVGFYGRLEVPDWFGVAGPLARAAEIRCPVLGLYGEDDDNIPLEQVREFDSRLETNGIEHEVHVYPGAPHSFFDRRYEQYAEACEDAWRRTLGFLVRDQATNQPASPGAGAPSIGGLDSSR